MTLLFIFDMDDVLYSYDWSVRMRALTDITGHDLAELRRRWWNDSGEWAAEAGQFATAEDYLAAVCAALGVDIPEDDWVRIRASAMTPFPGSLEAVRRASELGQVTLLTNNGPLISKHLATVAPELVDLFGEHLFTSSDYGQRKPEPEVFERVLAKYGVDASDAFFADDLAINIEGAAGLGITAHRFTTPEAMLAAIEDFAATH